MSGTRYVVPSKTVQFNRYDAGKVHHREYQDSMGGKMFSCTLSFTSKLDGVGSYRHAPTAGPQRMTRYPLYRRLGRPQGLSGGEGALFFSTGFDPRTVQSVASRYTDWAISSVSILRNISNVISCETYCFVPGLRSLAIKVIFLDIKWQQKLKSRCSGSAILRKVGKTRPKSQKTSNSTAVIMSSLSGEIHFAWRSQSYKQKMDERK